MNTSMKTFIIVTCLAGGYLTSCSTSAQKVENAQDEVELAKHDLDAANQEYMDDMKRYREEAAVKIAANRKSITEFNARMDNEKAEAKADYKMKIDAIEKKNSDLQKKMDEYKADSKDQWEKFKEELNHDMEELGTAFKNLTTTNNK